MLLSTLKKFSNQHLKEYYDEAEHQLGLIDFNANTHGFIFENLEKSRVLLIKKVDDNPIFRESPIDPNSELGKVFENLKEPYSLTKDREKNFLRLLQKEKDRREKSQQEELEKRQREEEARKAEALKRQQEEEAEAERLEQKRIAREKAEAERLEKERLEKERLEKERLEKERLEKEEAERKAAEEARKAKELKRQQEEVPEGETVANTTTATPTGQALNTFLVHSALTPKQRRAAEQDLARHNKQEKLNPNTPGLKPATKNLINEFNKLKRK